MALYPFLAALLGTFAVAAVLLAVALALALALPAGRDRVTRTLGGLERHPVAWASAVALIAMVGSLYFSEVVHLAPCSLCWYQRIAMYPLVVVLGVGVVRDEPQVWRYALPLAVIGLVIALYHVTIEWQPTLDVGVCTSGVPCSVRYFATFGFISIATMSASAFLLILVLLLLVRELERAGRSGEGADGR